MLGLPRLFKDEDISAEYPHGIDEEYINERDFLPIFFSDSSKGSSAIALFRCSRVLARVLDTVYATTLPRDESLLEELQNELERWRTELAPHLRLEFVNGVPATKAVHSQPLLLVCSSLLVLFCFVFSLFLFFSFSFPHNLRFTYISRDALYNMPHAYNLLTDSCLSLYTCFDSSTQYPLQ